MIQVCRRTKVFVTVGSSSWLRLISRREVTFWKNNFMAWHVYKDDLLIFFLVQIESIEKKRIPASRSLPYTPHCRLLARANDRFSLFFRVVLFVAEISSRPRNYSLGALQRELNSGHLVGFHGSNCACTFFREICGSGRAWQIIFGLELFVWFLCIFFSIHYSIKVKNCPIKTSPAHRPTTRISNPTSVEKKPKLAEERDTTWSEKKEK